MHSPVIEIYSMRFGGQSLLQKGLTEGSMCFGDQSLLQKVHTEGSMRFGGQSLLQKVLTEGTPGPRVSTHSTLLDGMQKVKTCAESRSAEKWSFPYACQRRN